MIDTHGRTIREVRLSVTDRCNFRCVYCMEPDERFLPPQRLLGVDDWARLTRVLVSLGVTKVRLTGGEPTLHPHLDRIISAVAGAGVDDLALTTNGSLLDDASLRTWKASGLTRITISLDSVDPTSFASMTRSAATSHRVIEAIRLAERRGLGPVKVNSVIVRGMNEDQVLPLARLARELAVEVRFIEFMPLDGAGAWSRDRVVPASEILDSINTEFALTADQPAAPGGTSETYRFADGSPGRIGVIAPVTRPFCGECGRLRITADGKVRPCLFSTREWDLAPLLRAEAPDKELRSFLIDATWTKQAGHGIGSSAFARPERTMSEIGG